MTRVEELEDILKRRDKAIKIQGQKIATLKMKLSIYEGDSEYKIIIDRYKMSESEYKRNEKSHLEEIEELKNEISELLELVSIEK